MRKLGIWTTCIYACKS